MALLPRVTSGHPRETLLSISGSAVRGLSANKMRTALTMLGIVIGVAVVILVVAIGEGASKSVTDSSQFVGNEPVDGTAWQADAPNHRRGSARGSAQAALAVANRLNMADSNLIQKDFPTTISALAPQARATVQVTVRQ